MSAKHLLNENWPSEHLESLDECPACGKRNFAKWKVGLTDVHFETACGEWNLHKCHNCESAFLNPRPDRDSISEAYGKYYTHQEPSDRDDYESLNFTRKIRRSLVNGYSNVRFGTTYRPANPVGYYVALALPILKRVIDTEFRGVESQPLVKSGQRRLLDIGCGNGAFLLKAKDAGWLVTGIDVDKKAVDVAIEHGLDARVIGPEELLAMGEKFDSITINHVIEHVHDPLLLISQMYALLNPGGSLYIDTPNIKSRGVKIYGSLWRGLEVPRHLTIFSPKALKNALADAGFSNIRPFSRANPAPNTFLSSKRAWEYKRSKYNGNTRLNFFERILIRIPHLSSESREFITVTASKPVA